jgi:hypothetical protein
MLPKWHILYSFVLAYLLIFFFHLSTFAALIFFLAAVCIDIDHYFLFVLNQKKFHPKKFWDWSMNTKEEWKSTEDKKLYKYPIFIFHGFEALLVLAALSFVNLFFFWIFLGFSFHLFLDLLHLIYREEELHKLSQIYTFKRNKNKKMFSY